MISMPAIDPAISTLPVMNQLIANVSSVPNIRQLTALSTDLVCVSAPRNKTTRRVSLADDNRIYQAHLLPAPLRVLRREIQQWTCCANACILLKESDKLID
jgi:hypothetical protein